MPPVTRTQAVNADAFFTEPGGGGNFGNGKGNRLLVGFHFSDAQWKNRMAIRIPRGSLFNGVPNAASISKFDIKLRVGPSGTSCGTVGGNVRFFLERATSAMAENSETGSCVASLTGTVGTHRWPGPSRTTTDRAFYSGSPSMGAWITVNALALGKWWFNNPSVSELTLVGIAANNGGTGHEETTLARRATFHSLQSSGSAPYAEMTFDANSPPNVATDLTPTGGVLAPSDNGEWLTMRARHTDPDGDAATALWFEVYPDSSTDESLGSPLGFYYNPEETTPHNTLRIITIGSLPTRTFVKWRVAFRDASAWGPWSPLQRAKTAFKPGVPAQPVVEPGTLAPRFYGSIVSQDPADFISAVEVNVWQDPAQGQTITKWASGKVTIGGSPNRAEVTYGGTALVFGTQYRWRIRLWNRDDVASEFTGNLYFTQSEAVGPVISQNLAEPTPVSLDFRFSSRTPTFALTDPGEANIDQYQVQYATESEVVIEDTGIQSQASAAKATSSPSAGTWDWGQQPRLRARIRLTGNADIGPWSNWSQVRINAMPGAPGPMSIFSDDVAQRPDGLWVYHGGGDGTLIVPFRDHDKDLGYADEAPSRLEVEIRTLADAHISGSPFVNPGGAESFVLPELTLETTYKARARHDDFLNLRGPWSQYLFFKPSEQPVVSEISPANEAVVTTPRPTISWTYSSSAGKTQARRRIQLLDNNVSLYDVDEASDATTHRIPAGVLPNNATIHPRITVFDTDGLASSPVEPAFTTDFTQPPALTGLTLTPDPDTASLLAEWDASTLDAEEFSHYLLSYRVAGQWTQIATLEEQVRGYASYLRGLDPTGWWRLGDEAGPLADEIAGRDLAVTGSPTFGVPGALQNDPDTAIEFSGSGQYAVGPTDFPTPSDSISVACLFRTTDASGSFRMFMGRQGGGQDSWRLGLNTVHRLQFAALQSAGAIHAVALQPSGALNDGNWHLAVGTFDGTTIRCYVDGAQVASSTSLTGTWHKASTVAPFLAATSGVLLFPGTLDEPAILNDIVLTAEEVAELWEMVTASSASRARYRFRGVPHNVDVQVQLQQHNGWMASEAAIETEMVELIGYWRAGPGSVHQLRYVRVGGHSGEPKTLVEEFDPPFGGSIVQTWGTAGYRGQFTIFVPPEPDLLEVLREDMRLGRAVWLKFPKGEVRFAKVTRVPDTDREVGFRDVGLSYTEVKPTEADYGTVET